MPHEKLLHFLHRSFLRFFSGDCLFARFHKSALVFGIELFDLRHDIHVVRLDHFGFHRRKTLGESFGLICSFLCFFRARKSFITLGPHRFQFFQVLQIRRRSTGLIACHGVGLRLLIAQQHRRKSFDRIRFGQLFILLLERGLLLGLLREVEIHENI